MRGMILAAALLLVTAGVSSALPPISFGVGINGQRPSPHFLQPPINLGVYNGHHAMTFPVPHGYQPWAPYYQNPWAPQPAPQPFYYYYDPSFSSFGLPSVPGVGPFEGWDAKPNNFVR